MVGLNIALHLHPSIGNPLNVPSERRLFDKHTQSLYECCLSHLFNAGKVKKQCRAV